MYMYKNPLISFEYRLHLHNWTNLQDNINTKIIIKYIKRETV